MAVCRLDDAKKNLSTIVSLKRGEIKAAFWDTFSKRGYGLTAAKTETLKNDLNNLQEALSDAKYKLKQLGRLVPDRKAKKDLRDEIRTLKQGINQMSVKIKDAPEKTKIIKRFESMLTEHIMTLADRSMYGDHIKPELIFPVFKDYMQTKMTFTFEDLSDLDNGTLIRFENRLGKDLAKIQNAAEKGDIKLSGFQNTVLPPKLVASMLDPTGLSYKSISMAGDLASNVAGQASSYMNTIQKAVQGIRELADNNYMFMHEPSGDMSASDSDQSFKNIGEFVTEHLDGQVMNIVPTPIVKRRAEDGQPIFTDEYIEDKKEWEDRIKINVANGINAGGWVQSFVDGNKQFYYTLIRKVDNEGKEYYRAYEVPFKEFETKEGTKLDRLELPPRGKKSSLKFFSEWFRRDEDSLAGYERTNPTTGKQESIPGRMPSGWYRASEEKVSRGKKPFGKDKGAETYTKGYANYVLDEKLNSQEIHPEIWQTIRDFRLMFKEMHATIIERNQAYEDKLLALLQKMFPDGLPRGSKNNLNKMIKDKLGLDVDTIDMNMAVRRVNGKDVIYTANTEYGELDNYVPRKRAFTDNIQNLLAAVKAAESTLAHNELAYSNVQVDDKDATGKIKAIEDRDNIKNNIKEQKDILDTLYQQLDHKLGLRETAPDMSQISLIKSAKHRGEIASALPKVMDVKDDETGEIVTRVINNGIRKDWHVFGEYINESFVTLNQNDVKLELLSSLSGMPDAIKDYTIDHVRSSFGRRDVDAGFLNWNYSDKKYAKKLGITPEELYDRGKFYSGLISANLLSGPTVSIANNMQRFGSAIISDINIMTDASNKRKDKPAETEMYANNAGLLDETNAIGDIFFGQSDAKEHWLDGARFWRNMAVMKLDKSEFVKATMNRSTKTGRWWNELVDILQDAVDPNMKADEVARKDVLEDIWEVTAGISKLNEKGMLNQTQKKALEKRLNNNIMRHLLSKHVQWAFGGSALTRRFAPGVDWLKFSNTEKNMRMEQIYVAGSMLKNSGRLTGLTDKELYMHPETIKLARLLVNNVMFSMSQANLPKMFKGATGGMLWKFKPYQWNQIGAEYNVILGAWDEFTSKYSKGNRFEIIKKLLSSRKQGSETMNQFRNFMVYRVLLGSFAMSAYNMALWSPAKPALRFIANRVPGGYKFFNAYGRGLTSQIAEGFFNVAMMGLFFAGFTSPDEDEDIWQDIRRFFLPLFVNLAIESYKEEDPTRPLQVFQRDAHMVINQASEYVNRSLFK